ncbi:MAG: hypothetical protein NTY60_03135 [Proteobacteria bacterium]|nr:hypothetical protein [Pseudomonadota bacterium]
MFSKLFSLDQITPALLQAIERAVLSVEPMLKQTGGYPAAYRKPVMHALEYARSLALCVPGPVVVNPDSFARDNYVHAIFPSMDSLSEALRSSVAMQAYLREQGSGDEIYALMGMRRMEKTITGMELSGQVIQQDVLQHMVYFVSHTIENPAPSEQQARDQIAWRFFDSLLDKVAKRVTSRKQQMQVQRQELDALMDSLRAAGTETRPALEEKLSGMLSGMPDTATALEDYTDDFDAVLLNPEKYLRLSKSSMALDSMGVQRDVDETTPMLVFSELVGFDRRDWTVTMVNCRNMKQDTFTERLETAYRMLSI